MSGYSAVPTLSRLRRGRLSSYFLNAIAIRGEYKLEFSFPSTRARVPSQPQRHPGPTPGYSPTRQRSLGADVMGISRRDILRLTAGAVVAPAFLRASPARAALPPLPNLPESDALLLTPGDSRYSKYLPSFNKRTMKSPQLRAMCRTPRAVTLLVSWVRDNAVPFALRGGGHCYEDFSESDSVVIDTRMIDHVSVDTARRIVTAGAGAALGDIYKAMKNSGFAIPAGSCPTVGVAGHVLGGGFGFLARAYGLACDRLQSIDVVNPDGKLVTADSNRNPDLFWASRGGGGGTFGAVTRFRLGLVAVRSVVVFKVTWTLPEVRAARIFGAWQDWAPNAPRAITSFCRVTKTDDGKIDVHCAGQSIGPPAALRKELTRLTSVEKPSISPSLETLPFFDAVNFFSGGWSYQSSYMKGKSDYLTSPMSDAGIATLMGPLLTPSLTAICDSYGGAVAAVAAGDTAFPHRAGTLFGIQYATTWENAADSASRLAEMRALYDAMRPYVSGSAYVNYCDLDLVDWPQVYWGRNLTRLKAIKSAFDPQNLFSHAQSVH
jgi:FAD/FMN-containing dehydrogenase